MKGGARKGAGRPAGPPTTLMNFRIRLDLAERLRTEIGNYKMTEFVEHAILTALNNKTGKLLYKLAKHHPKDFQIKPI